MGRGAVTPLHCSISLGQHVRSIKFTSHFGLEHVDRIFRLGYKVRLVLRMIRTRLVEDLKLSLRRPEPLLRLSFEYDRKLALRFGIELLHRVQAMLKAPK